MKANRAHHSPLFYLPSQFLSWKYNNVVPSEAPDHIDRIVEQWRRERPDVDVTALGILGRLFRAASLAETQLATGLAPHDLQPGWFDLLAALRRAGSPYELTPTALMGATMLTSGGVTKRLDRLAEAGLIERRPDPADRRGTLVGLTPAGRKAIDAAVKTHAANEQALLSVMSAADRRALDLGLRSLLAALTPRTPD
jgi:DNA-binding MarR family transcriptional regulator